MSWGAWVLLALVGAAALQEPAMFPVAIGLVAFILVALRAIEWFTKAERKP